MSMLRIAGIAAAAAALLVPFVVAPWFPGYSHLADYISELGAAEAPTRQAAMWFGFLPAAVFTWVFLAALGQRLPRDARTIAALLALGAAPLAYAGAIAFPCDPGCPATGSASQAVHNLLGLAEYAGALVGLTLIVTPMGRLPNGQRLAAYTRVARLLVAAGFVLMVVPDLAPFRGAAQRLAEAGIFGWIVLVATHSGERR